MKLLTEFDGHPKVLSVGLAGAGLYARALCHCGKYETDGRVPRAWVEQAQANDKQVLGLEHRLVEEGLWEETEDGYQITDFTEVNRSREEMERLRESRSAAGKKGGSSKQLSKPKARHRASVPSNSLSSSNSVSQGKKVNRKPVTDSEYELTEQVVAAFNDAAGTRYSADAHLVPVVGRIREHPDLTAEDHRQIIAAVFRNPWWEGNPGPEVVYGNAAQFERSMQLDRSRNEPAYVDA